MLKAKEPSESLLAGRRALDGLAGVEIVEDWKWISHANLWALHVALSPPLTPTEFVPARTNLYVTTEDRYPLGTVTTYPAKRDSITATFQHQSLNLEGQADLPWRTGELCLATNFRRLGREGYDHEARSLHGRLRWHVERALDWLLAASQDRLAESNEPFELPPLGNRGPGTVVFAENTARFRQWAEIPASSGLVSFSPLGEPASRWYVRSFQTAARGDLLRSEWGTALAEGEEPSSEGIWIRLPRVPVIPPWRLPATWGELKSALASQKVEFDQIFRSALAPLLRDGKPHFCLLGFPIPERIGGSAHMLYWQAIRLPALTTAHSKGGFGAEPNKLWQRDRELIFTSGGSIAWVETENWDKAQIQTRGILPEVMTSKRAVVIGLGAIGSVLAELLIRGGVETLLLIDSDKLEIGNLTRHTLTMAQIDKYKASSVAARSNLISPHAKVRFMNASFEELDENERSEILNAEIVWDCTASDDLLRGLETATWQTRPRILSLSLSFGARRLFLYSQRAPVSIAWFSEKLEPWLIKDLEERGDDELPREGIGCWHPVFPAASVDVHLMVALALKAISSGYEAEPSPSFRVFEQVVENGVVVGVQQIEK